MAKEILLYGTLYDFSVSDVIKSLDELGDSDGVLRINSNGGSPEDTWGIIAKMLESKGKISIKVDGRAHSAAAFFLAYSNDVEALDVSQFLIHRAAYSKYFESSDNFNDATKANLNKINADLRSALEAKIDTDEFENITGKTLDQIFSLNDRVDVFLNAQQAKKIGLIDKIVEITPQRRFEIQAYNSRIAAELDPIQTKNQPTIKPMDIIELKAKHPELFAQIVNESVEQERDRVGAWLGFADVDVKAVTDGIASGKPMSQTQMVDFTRKSFAKETLAAVSSEAPAAAATATQEASSKTPEQERIQATKIDCENEVFTLLGLKK